MVMTEDCYSCKYFERWCYNTGGQEDIDNEDFEDLCKKGHNRSEFLYDDKCQDFTKKAR